MVFREDDFSYSFSLLSPPSNGAKRRITANLVYNGASGRGGVSIPSVMDGPRLGTKEQGLAIRAATRAWRVGVFALLTLQLALCYLRILLHALPLWRSERLERMTFGEWAEETVPRGLLASWTGMDTAWRDFTQSVLAPLFSAVCTAPVEDVIQHPVEEFLGECLMFPSAHGTHREIKDYIWLTLGTHHYVVANGVRDAVTRLSSNIRHIHLSSPISSIHPDPHSPHLAMIHCATAGGIEIHTGFHHIIFATQASRAVPLLASYASSLQGPDAVQQRLAVEEQIRCLRTFEYRTTIVINHTDGTLMPDDARDRRDLNLIYTDQEETDDTLTNARPMTVGDVPTPALCVPPTYTMATHVLPRPKGYPVHSPAVYQTTNAIIPPREDSILSVAKLERAVLTVHAKEALKGLYREEGRRWWQCAGQAESRLGGLQGAGRLGSEQGPGIWICGSFAYAGIPLLEGCVVSARNVVEQGVWRCEGITSSNPPW